MLLNYSNYKNLLENEYIYIPGYVPIPLSYLYQLSKKEKNQESNSVYRSQILPTFQTIYNAINHQHDKQQVFQTRMKARRVKRQSNKKQKI